MRLGREETHDAWLTRTFAPRAEDRVPGIRSGHVRGPQFVGDLVALRGPHRISICRSASAEVGADAASAPVRVGLSPSSYPWTCWRVLARCVESDPHGRPGGLADRPLGAAPAAVLVRDQLDRARSQRRRPWDGPATCVAGQRGFDLTIAKRRCQAAARPRSGQGDQSPDREAHGSHPHEGRQVNPPPRSLHVRNTSDPRTLTATAGKGRVAGP